MSFPLRDKLFGDARAAGFKPNSIAEALHHLGHTLQTAREKLRGLAGEKWEVDKRGQLIRRDREAFAKFREEFVGEQLRELRKLRQEIH